MDWLLRPLTGIEILVLLTAWKLIIDIITELIRVWRRGND